MKAKSTKFLNMEDMDNIYYGIEVKTADGQRMYAKDDNGPIISKDKSEITKKVREFNKQHNIKS
jgi:hypothetical protein